MTQTIRVTIISSIFSMLVLSCMDDTFSDSGPVCSQGYAPIRMTLTVPDAPIVQTRAVGTGDASIESFSVLLFDTSKGKADESKIGLVAHRLIDDMTITSVELPLSTKSRLVYVVANAKKYLSDIPVTDNDLKDSSGDYQYSLQHIRNLLTTKLISRPDDKGFITGADIPDIPLPMSAEIDFLGGLSSNSEINAELVRMVSKISVSTPLSSSRFQIKGLTICNGAESGSILAPSNIDKEGVGLGRIAYTVVDSMLYAYPTAVGGTDEPVSVVVEAQYNGQAKSSFYRLLISKDLTNANKGLSLKRNYHYRIKINRVGKEGEKDLDTALSSPPSNIDYAVTESNDFTHTTIVNGNMFSVDCERLIVYADSLDFNSLAVFRTNYPFQSGRQEGMITLDAGLTLQGNLFFTEKDTVKSLIVKVESSYSHSTHSETSPKGLHLSLGGYRKTIEIIRKPSVDLHPVTVELANISEAKFISSSGDMGSAWVDFSLSPVYSIYNKRSALDGESLKQSGNKGYLHLDENMNSDYRELFFETISSAAGATVRHVLRQEGTKNYILGFFGGTLEKTSTVFQYSRQLIIEAYEENEELLPLLPRLLTEDEQKTMYDVFEDGKQSTITLAEYYDSPAALYCLNKNRDTNGNGRIDDEEVLWYLPGVRQGMGILLYQALANNLSQSYWSSSCILNEYDEGLAGVPSMFKVAGVWGLTTVFNPEGYRVKLLSYNQATTEKRSIRCVRDF